VLGAISAHTEPSYTPTLPQDAVAVADAWQMDNIKVALPYSFRYDG
jgi:metal-dependent HD superfamily phosphatase/phosphodiesterase